MEKQYTWEDLGKIAPPNKWMLMYKDYSDMITREDVAAFWHEQFLIANKERNELKSNTK